MAEGGHIPDLENATLCSSCDENGQMTEAVFYCLLCESNLCFKCMKNHSITKATESHEIIGIEELISMSSLDLGSEALIETPLCKEHSQNFKHFCMEHRIGLCHTCRLMDHKACKEVMRIEKAAAQVYSEGHSEKILKSVCGLQDTFEELKILWKRNREKLIQQRQTALDSLKEIRQRINSYLDRLESTAIAKIGSVSENEIKSIDDRLNACEASITFLTNRKHNLERTISVGEKEAVFIVTNNATKDIRKYCERLREINQEIVDTQIKFEQSDTCAKLRELITDIGTVSVTKSPAPNISTCENFIYTGEVQLKSEIDTDNPFITSYKVLHDGRKLLADNTNKKLKLFDPNDHLLSELSLPDNPWNIVLLSDTQAVISSLLTETLQYIRIEKDLTLTDVESTGFQVFAMAKYGCDIIASIYDDAYKIAVIDKRGNIKQIVYKDDGSVFNKPDFIGLSADHKTVYIVDSRAGCFGINIGIDSNVKILSLDSEVKNNVGLAVYDDCLFIGVDKGKLSGKRSEVRRIGFDGEIKELVLGNSHPLKVVENELVVFNKDNRDNPLLNFYFLL